MPRDPLLEQSLNRIIKILVPLVPVPSLVPWFRVEPSYSVDIQGLSSQK